MHCDNFFFSVSGEFVWSDRRAFFSSRSSNKVDFTWFMHPVARVSINKYRNLSTQQMLPLYIQ
jgi:hypothetical protein